MPNNPIWYGDMDSALDHIYGRRHKKMHQTAIMIAVLLVLGGLGYGWVTKPAPKRFHYLAANKGTYMFDLATDSVRYCSVTNGEMWCTDWAEKKEEFKASIR